LTVVESTKKVKGRVRSRGKQRRGAQPPKQGGGVVRPS